MADSSKIEVLAPGVTCEWLHDNAIVVFKVATSNRNDVGLMFDKMQAVIEQWPADQPYLALQDLSETAGGMTPYARARAKVIAAWRPNLEAHVALVTQPTFQSRLIRLFMDA